MKILCDTHTHTIMSGHAYSTIREMAREAYVKGLEAIALTEHAPLMPGTVTDIYFHNMKVLPKEMEGVRLLKGVELNILDEWGNVDLEEELCNTLEIVLASMHPPCYGKSKGIVKNTQAYVNAIKKPYIHIIGHPDDGRYPVDYDTIVAAAKEHKVLLECNNSSVSPNSFREKGKENQLEYLALCKKYKTQITLGSDAHIDIDVANHKYVLEILNECNFPKELVANTSLENLKKYINI